MLPSSAVTKPVAGKIVLEITLQTTASDNNFVSTLTDNNTGSVASLFQTAIDGEYSKTGSATQTSGRAVSVAAGATFSAGSLNAYYGVYNTYRVQAGATVSNLYDF